MNRMDSTEIHRVWADREGEYSPEYYAYYGPNDTSEAIQEVIESAGLDDPSVLELGCSSGRHLAYLVEHGYRDVAGIDINPEAVAVLRETYSELADVGSFYIAPIEDQLPDFEAGAFDVVFSIETLQHVPSEQGAVFDSVARVTDDLLITVERESGNTAGDDDESVTYVNDEFPLYYREWDRIFGERDFEQIEARNLGRYMLRAFKRSP